MNIEEKVREFHVKHGFPIDQPMRSGRAETDLILNLISQLLLSQSKLAETVAIKAAQEGDPRLYRMYLILEECAEVAAALSKADRTNLAHELGDLRYVAVGTDVTFGIPSSDVDEEIHRANMTKKVRSEDNFRMRDKGPDYTKPDIEGVLNRVD